MQAAADAAGRGAGEPAAPLLSINPPACSEDSATSRSDDGSQELLQELARVIGSLPDWELFPSPPCPPRPSSSSRRVLRRHYRALHLWEVACRARTTLLALIKPGSDAGHSQVTGRFRNCTVSESTRTRWTHLVQEAKRVAEGRRASFAELPTGVALLGKVLRAELNDVYSRVHVKQTYHPFIADRVVEPKSDANKVYLIDVLPAHLAYHYRDLAGLLRTSEEVKLVRKEFAGRYCRVSGDHREWVKYLHRDDVQPLWHFRPASEAQFLFSISTVLKKDQPMLRKLAQCVPLNAALVSPAEMLGQDTVDYGLVGAVAITQAQTQDDNLSVLTMDESNAFTHVETPATWWPFMGGPLLKARDVPQERRDPSWPDGLWISPQYKRLGMGFTHAVFILQTINVLAIETAVRASARLSARHIIVRMLNHEEDRRTRLQLLGTDPVEVGVYVHLDDVAVMGGGLASTSLVADVAKAALEALGFIVTT